MDIMVNTLGVLSSIAAISGLSIVQVISYYRKSVQRAQTTKAPQTSLNHQSRPTLNNARDNITLSFALLIGISFGLFITYMIIILVRMVTYFPFPPANLKAPSMIYLLAVNFSDLRFDIGLIIGIFAGAIISAWMTREIFELLLEYRKLNS